MLDLDRVYRHSQRSTFVADMGIVLVDAGDGWAVSELRPEGRHAQGEGFAHAAVVTAMLDHTGGMAVLTQLEASRSVLTAELKVNFLRPAEGRLLRCRAEVVHLGGRLGVAEARLWVVEGEGREALLAAIGLVTLAPIPGRREA